MGYTTEFDGQVTIDPPLNEAEISFLNDLATTRRMDRTKGPLFVKGTGFHGQGHDDDVIDFNREPADQPGLWLHWVPTEDGRALEWDGGEKFYAADEWMKYVVENLLAPSARAYIDAHINEDWRLPLFTFDHVVNGEINAEGEEPGDLWRIVVRDNVVMTARAELSFPEPTPV